MIFCLSQEQHGALLKRFIATLEDVPGTDCQRSRHAVFAYSSNRMADNYRTYDLPAPAVALLLERGKIPTAALAAYQRTCPTEDCVNAEHYRRRPHTTDRTARIDHASTAEDFFPPRLRRAISPQGYAQSGSRNYRTRLTRDQVEEILRQRYCFGFTYRRISENTGLKLRAVCSVCNGNAHRIVAQSILPLLIEGARKNGILKEAE